MNTILIQKHEIKEVKFEKIKSKLNLDLIKISFLIDNDLTIVYSHYISLSSNSENFNYFGYKFLQGIFNDKKEFDVILKRIGYKSSDIVNFINNNGATYMKEIKNIHVYLSERHPLLVSIEFKQ